MEWADLGKSKVGLGLDGMGLGLGLGLCLGFGSRLNSSYYGIQILHRFHCNIEHPWCSLTCEHI